MSGFPPTSKIGEGHKMPCGQLRPPIQGATTNFVNRFGHFITNGLFLGHSDVWSPSARHFRAGWDTKLKKDGETQTITLQELKTIGIILWTLNRLPSQQYPR